MENLSQFPNPLLELHRQAAEVETIPFGTTVEIVNTFGQPQLEYAAIHKSCGLMDRPHRGVLELTGRDRLSFLNGLITNTTWDKETKQPIPSGTNVYAFLLNLKGRIICDMNVIELGDRTLLEMDVRMVEAVKGVFDQYLFAEQVRMRSLIGELHEIALYGPKSRDGALISGFETISWRDNPTGSDGLVLLVPTDRISDVYKHLLELKVRPIGWAAFNACRIEAGTPLFGIDFDGAPPQTAYPSKKAQQEAESDSGPGVLPAETGSVFDRAVSLTKCYIGQEVVARMHARKALARRIVGIRMADDALPIAGAPVADADGNQVGIVTSSTVSPIMSNAALCLAFVKKPHFAPGTTLHIPAEGQMRTGMVEPLPFKR
jgi:folate-binding protein YgfZ